MSFSSLLPGFSFLSHQSHHPPCPPKGSEEFHVTSWSHHHQRRLYFPLTLWTQWARFHMSMGYIGNIKGLNPIYKWVLIFCVLQELSWKLLLSGLPVLVLNWDPSSTRTGCSCKIKFIVLNAMLHTSCNLIIAWRVDSSSPAVEM